MRKVAVIPAVLLTVLCTLTGCKKEEVEKVIEPLVADIQTAETSQEAQEEEDPVIPRNRCLRGNSAGSPHCGGKQEYKRFLLEPCETGNGTGCGGCK